MERYSVIKEKNPREIVLLKGFSCAYGKCAFCNYILDNTNNQSKEDGRKYNTVEELRPNRC